MKPHDLLLLPFLCAALSAADAPAKAPAKEAPAGDLPVATRVDGSDFVKSPISGYIVKVTGIAEGTKVADPKDSSKMFSVPGGGPNPGQGTVFPVGKPVDSKPNLVLSPYSGKPVDISGIASGTIVKDPSLQGMPIFRLP